MRLRRLRVSGFRKHSDPVEIDFDDRLTFVTGPNEVGKSTIFEALRYALFRRSGAAAKDIEALKPWANPTASPRIELDFVADDGNVYRLVKTWGSKGSAELGRLQNGEVSPINVGDIDGYVASQFYGSPPGKGAFSGFKATHQGLGYLLFAPQGKMILKTNGDVDGSIGPQAVGRLGELVGSLAISRDDERVIRAIGKRYGEYYTPTGKLRKAAPSAALHTKLEVLEQELQGAHADRERFEKVAKDLEELERDCLEREREVTDARKERDEKQPRMHEAAHLKTQLDAARERHEAAKKLFEDLHRRLQDVDLQEAHITELRRPRAVLEGTLGELQVTQNEARKAQTETQAEFSAAFADDNGLLADESRLQRAQQAAASAEKLHSIQELLREVQSIQGEVQELVAQIAAIPEITRTDVEKLSHLLEERGRLEADIRSSSMQIQVNAKRSVGVRAGTSNVELAQGEAFCYDAVGEAAFSIEDIADVIVRGPVADLSKEQERLASVRNEIGTIVSAFASHDPLELERQRAERESLIVTREKCDKSLRQKLGANIAIEKLQEKEVSYRQAAEDALPGDQLELLAKSVSERKGTLEKRRSSARARLEVASACVGEANEGCDLKRAEIADVDRAITDRELERVRAIGDAKTREELARRETSALAATAATQREAYELEQRYEPYREISDPARELRKLVDRVDELGRLFNEETNKREVKRNEFQSLQSLGISKRIAVLDERAAEGRREVSRAECEEAACKLLSDLIEEMTSNRNRELAEPLLATVSPWFERVSGHTLAELTLTEDATASQLRLRDVGIPVGWEDLSIGTADQLGVLLRLALAKELASKAPLPVLLDDPLAHCDPRRTVRLLDVIVEASEYTQVIVFTYDESMCAGLGKVVPLR